MNKHDIIDILNSKCTRLRSNNGHCRGCKYNDKPGYFVECVSHLIADNLQLPREITKEQLIQWLDNNAYSKKQFYNTYYSISTDDIPETIQIPTIQTTADKVRECMEILKIVYAMRDYDEVIECEIIKAQSLLKQIESEVTNE